MSLRESYIEFIMKMLPDLSEHEIKRIYEYVQHRWLYSESVISREK